MPEDGYQGDYVSDLAAALPDDVWAAATADGADTAGVIGHWAAGRVREGIEASLEALGVHFDVWTSEARLHDEGWVARAVERLRERGHVYEQDGAVWFRSTAFGDDKDRVIYRSNGEPTYFAADIGYVTEKFSRGFDHLIYIWGADHHGTVARLRNAAEAMGYDREAVQVLLYSWVRFVRDGQEISMSKRAGEFITLDELLAEVGVDAARWFFASRAVTTEIDFDIELAKKQSNENPVYYVQYAHARIASILRKAADARARARARGRRGAGRRARGRPGARDRPLPGGRRGRGRGRGDAGRHGLRDRARDDVPRVLPRRAGRGRRRAGAVGGTAGAGRGGADHARQRAGAAGDLRARVDVGRAARHRTDGPERPSFAAAYPARPSALATFPSVPRRWRRGPSGSCRRHPAAPRDRPAPCRVRSSRPSRRRPRRLSVSQAVCIADGPGAVGSLDDGQPIATPAGGGRRRRGRIDAALPQPDPDLELAERVLERDASSRSRAASRGRPASSP